ncbi:thiamine pyrophosphate-binding protein [Sphaerisporangium album]|uniref:Thiamine pyrophosphate-binding protein n=1 Tax=Sphaerisporangium album TaxID=509200 RepID=A0A367FJU0_9ACTN|nr:thiamine pyrophosphate-binding protein [Sphaerisporangium album]RCG30663.1 thiamine pyrophosphate-binding protein [Sphaerisporangium album]
MIEPVWTALAAALASAGCQAVFGLPSDDPGLLDAADRHDLLRTVLVRDQRVAACAAAGHAAVSRSPAVLAVTSGPSVVNALTGLLEAASMAVPIVVVTTRIGSREIGRGGFQEVDQEAMAGPLLKWHTLVEGAEQVPWAVRRAVHLALNGRPGLTMLVVAAERREPDTDHPQDAGGRPRRLRSVPEPADLDHAAGLLRRAQAPVVLAGGGTRWGDAGRAVERLAEAVVAPIFTTGSGRGSVDETHPLTMGLAGLYATPPATELLEGCDLLLAVGTRLEETVRTGWEAFARVPIVHVDQDHAAFDTARTSDHRLLGDAELVCAELAARLRDRPPDPARARERGERIGALRGRLLTEAAGDVTGSPVRRALACLGDVLDDDAIIVQENGLHDMWSYHFPLLTVRRGMSVVTPGEQTMMGFGVAASVGAASCVPHRQVVVLAGDGAVSLSMNALATMGDLRLGVVIVVFDNQGFGWPRHLRRLDGAPAHLTRFRAPLPVAELARAFGGWSATPATEAETKEALRTACEVAKTGQPALVRIAVPDDDVPAGVDRVFSGPGH